MAKSLVVAIDPALDSQNRPLTNILDDDNNTAIFINDPPSTITFHFAHLMRVTGVDITFGARNGGFKDLTLESSCFGTVYNFTSSPGGTHSFQCDETKPANSISISSDKGLSIKEVYFWIEEGIVFLTSF